MFLGTLSILYDGFINSYASYRLKPTSAIVFLTYRCTSKCKTCNIWKRPIDIDAELSWAEWSPVFEELARSGVKHVELFGGDALLRKELLLNMITFCNRNNIETYLPTNSNLLDEDTIKALLSAGLGTIYFSLDEIPGADKQIRGEDKHYDKVERAISITLKNRQLSNKINIICITTISKHNFEYIDKLVERVGSLGVDRHVLRGVSEFSTKTINNSKVGDVLPEPFFVPATDNSNGLTKEEAQDLLKSVEYVKAQSKTKSTTYLDTKNLDDLKVDLLADWRYPKSKCYFCTNVIIVDPSANILPCLFYNKYILGNLRTDKVSAVWTNEKHRLFNKMQKKNKLEMCQHCSVKFYHKGFPGSISYLLKRAKQKYLF